ncbi:hypothetical protein FDI90_gp094 [Pseudomonas phage PA7]|uniref:Uncharacterized protein n=1 Tax=Pseudomonas phage PA7 TaxID=347330 RepID=I7DAH4_9CAUD|nr:hypothetical protein FDI90_gp094 [Pseudomonas phage PA7]AFO70901.1 hypothetical protein [Pseudomonas phage PA7]QXN68411.1 hypothetical protein [Pseudomonas phage PA7]
MTIYFEGTGEPRAATFSEVRDLFVDAVKSNRHFRWISRLFQTSE